MSNDWRAAFAGAGVAVYDDVLVPRMFNPLAEQVLDLAGVQAGDRVLDVACGPGTVACLAAERVGPTGRVVGCDVSPAMLELARAKLSAVQWIESPAAPLGGIPDAAFDVVTCQQGLQFFPDRPAAVAEMHRALAPGGRAVVAVWGPIERSPAFAALADAIEDVVGKEAADRFRGGPWGMPDPGDLARLLEGAGFEDVQVVQRTATGTFEEGAVQLAAPLVVSPAADDILSLTDAQAAALVEAADRHAEPLTEGGAIRNAAESNVAIGVRR